MIPLVSASALSRTKKFAQEEWDAYFKPGAVSDATKIDSGWKSIVYAKLALIGPRTNFDFFNRTNFDPNWLDGGASRTWYLTFAAGAIPLLQDPSSFSSRGS